VSQLFETEWSNGTTGALQPQVQQNAAPPRRWRGPSARPRISVVIPTFNRARFLPSTVGSVLNQTSPVYEVILVDDGSHDGTAALVAKLQSTRVAWKQRVKYVRQPNAGKSAALNAGLRLAEGNWIAFNDSDDWWHARKIELQLEALAQFEEADACFSDVRFVNSPLPTTTPFEDSLPGRARPFGIERDVPRLFGASWPGIYMQSVVVSREALARFGEFDASIRMSMDTDLGFRLGMLTPMCFVNMPLVFVDRSEPRLVGLTTEYPMQSIERLQVHERLVGKWLELTRQRRPELRQQLLNHRAATQSALANVYLERHEDQSARAVLRRATAQHLTLPILAKWAWASVSPDSLRRELRRRERAGTREAKHAGKGAGIQGTMDYSVDAP
jgi:hypothetical protein